MGYATKGIRVNVVGLGFIKTLLLEKNLTKEQIDQLKDLHPMGLIIEGLGSHVSDVVDSFRDGGPRPVSCR